MSIDMGDILADPDLCSNFAINCVRRPRTTSDAGLTTFVPPAGLPFVIYAEVVPANGRQLMRLADMDRTGAGIAVYTTTELIAESPGYAADIIYWKGQPYLVAYVDDFSTNGYYAAVATLTQVVGPVPGTLPG